MSDAAVLANPVREVDGRSVPDAGAWTVDATHSNVAFVARHLVVAKTRGRFGDYDVQFVVGERPEDSKLSVTIRANSITTGDDGRDGHLKSADFLDVDNFPTLTYVSSSVRPTGSTWRVDGDLTVHGVTKPVPLTVEFNGATIDPWGNERAFFSAEAEFDREEFGITWNQPLPTGGVVIGRKVKIEIEIEATRATP